MTSTLDFVPQGERGASLLHIVMKKHPLAEGFIWLGN
jgi:hypothetical protein